ncbi:MAG TPA: RNA polymerase sigma factor [Pirellulaceae bacterium]|nr:RNA polymerase sigma factor [Pirellulaceae bacterium]
MIRGLREGRRDAWTTLYDEYSVDIWRYVGHLVGGTSSEVGDVVQETFLAAARGAAGYDERRGSLWSWLAGIAHHQAAAHLRRGARKARLQTLVETGFVALRQGWDGAGEAARDERRAELGELIRLVLAELSDDYAALLAAKYLDGRTLEQLVGLFGGTVEALKSKLARARREFREAFARHTGDATPTAARETARETTRAAAAVAAAVVLEAPD